jgi:hypothetical protein
MAPAILCLCGDHGRKNPGSEKHMEMSQELWGLGQVLSSLWLPVISSWMRDRIQLCETWLKRWHRALVREVCGCVMDTILIPMGSRDQARVF